MSRVKSQQLFSTPNSRKPSVPEREGLRFYRAVNLHTGHEIESRGSWVPIVEWGDFSDRIMIKSTLIQRHPLAAGLQLKDIEIEFLPMS